MRKPRQRINSANLGDGWGESTPPHTLMDLSFLEGEVPQGIRRKLAVLWKYKKITALCRPAEEEQHEIQFSFYFRILLL